MEVSDPLSRRVRAAASHRSKGITMLVLSRKERETIVIDERIVIHLNRALHGRATIGIEAPPEVHIRRGELAPRLPIAAHAALDPSETGPQPVPCPLSPVA
jgi:carbon storage regulator